MAVEDDRSVRRLPDTLASNATTKNFWSARQMTVESVRSCLNIMMKSQQTVFCIRLLWIPIPLDILLQDLMICQ